MIILDTNVLVYAVNEDSPMHAIARSFVEAKLRSGEDIGLPWLSIIGFITITTLPNILKIRLSPSHAMAQVDRWLNHPNVSTPEPGKRHFQIMQTLILAAGQAANLTNDAHLAAIAIERNATMVSFDQDFARFSGLKLEIPSSTIDALARR